MSKIKIREQKLKQTNKQTTLLVLRSVRAFKHSTYSYIHGGPSCKLKVFHVNCTLPFTETFDFAFKTTAYAFEIIFIVLSSSGDKEKRWKILVGNLDIGILCISTYCPTIPNTDNTDCSDLFKHVFKALTLRGTLGLTEVSRVA